MESYVVTRSVKAAFTADATAQGIITVGASDAPNLWPGAVAVVGSGTQTPVEVLILEDLGSNTFRVRLTAGAPTPRTPSPRVAVPGAGSDLSAFKLADSGYILQLGGQHVWQYTHDGVIPRTPSALK